MKNILIRNRLIAILSSIYLLMPVAYAESDDNNLVSIKQMENINSNTTTSSFVVNDFNNSDEVLITQQGDNNFATVDINGNNNQLGLTQEGNRNNGNIQIDGNRNNLSMLQSGNEMRFGLKIEGDNRAYTLIQEKR